MTNISIDAVEEDVFFDLTNPITVEDVEDEIFFVFVEDENDGTT